MSRHLVNAARCGYRRAPVLEARSTDDEILREHHYGVDHHREE